MSRHSANDAASALTALDQRRSTPARLLTAPGPEPDQLRRILASALRVPDHGKLTPWRIVTISGDSRRQLGEFVAGRRLEIEPGVAPAALDKDRMRFGHAPLILAVLAAPRDTDRIPEQEQLLSAGCVCFALLMAAQGLGFGAQWLTGWPAYDPAVAQHLGLAANERIIGFIHIGTAQSEPPERPRPDPADLVSEWTP